MAAGLARRGSLPRRRRPRRCGPGRRGLAALLAALVRRLRIHLLAAARAALLAAAGLFVHGGPGPALRLRLGRAAVLVASLDVLGLTFLLLGVLRLVSA